MTTDQSRKEAYKAFCDENANRGYSKEDVFKAGWQAARQAEREEVLEEAAQCANSTPFRCHNEKDIEFHSGCVQTRERIIDAIRALKEPPNVGSVTVKDKIQPTTEQQAANLKVWQDAKDYD